MKKTLIIGASEKPERYSNKAIRSLSAHGHEVVALAPRQGQVGVVNFITEKKNFDDIHTVSLYIGPQIQEEYIEYIINLKPQRVIFNPGTENAQFAEKLSQNGIKYEYACTLVLLSIGAF